MGELKVLLAGTDEHDLTKLDAYRAIGGYAQVPKARAMTPEALIDELLAANLRGRGGAGFPMGRKASLIDRGSAKPKYLVVNADESELGISAGQTTEDGQVTLRVVECLNGCGYAPVVSVDRRHRHPVKPEDVPSIVEELRADS